MSAQGNAETISSATYVLNGCAKSVLFPGNPSPPATDRVCSSIILSAETGLPEQGTLVNQLGFACVFTLAIRPVVGKMDVRIVWDDCPVKKATIDAESKRGILLPGNDDVAGMRVFGEEWFHFTPIGGKALEVFECRVTAYGTYAPCP